MRAPVPGQLCPGPTARLNPRLCRSDKRLVAIAYGISNGMRFLHKNHICHRDLKSHNVLYDKQLNIKLCDFAFSKFKATLEKKSVRFESRVGTPQWMAPEVLRGEEYTFSAGQIPPFPHPAGQPTAQPLMQARVFWLRCLQFWRDSVGDDLAAAAVRGLPRYGGDVQGGHGRAAPDAAG